jgi:WhiB family transcriptional regulator, redox-sensing transcriptional regulator
MSTLTLVPPGAVADWRSMAACRTADPEIFFPEAGAYSGRQAKLTCSRCPVRAECLQFALDHGEEFGIWAGTTERERRGLRLEIRQDADAECRNGHQRTEENTYRSAAGAVRCRDCEREQEARRPARTRRKAA